MTAILSTRFSTFFFLLEARKQPHPSTADRVRGGSAAPQIHAGRPSQQQKLPQGAPGSYSQDTATGTSPTWPPASGSVVCTLYNTLPKDISSCSLNQEDLFE